MSRIKEFLYSLLPNIKQYAIPTAKELNESPEGSRYPLACEGCEETTLHTKQLNNNWKCSSCGHSLINFEDEPE